MMITTRFLFAALLALAGAPLGAQHTYAFQTCRYFPETVGDVYPARTRPDVDLTPPIRVTYSDADAGAGTA